MPAVTDPLSGPVIARLHPLVTLRVSPAVALAGLSPVTSTDPTPVSWRAHLLVCAGVTRGDQRSTTDVVPREPARRGL